MNKNSRTSIVLGRSLVTVLGLTGLLLATSGRTLVANSNDARDGLTGAWSIQVTLRDCATGAPRRPADELARHIP